MYQHLSTFMIFAMTLLLFLLFFFQVFWLSGNPLSSEPGYRRRVIRKLQQIKKLDNIGTLHGISCICAQNCVLYSIVFLYFTLEAKS